MPSSKPRYCYHTPGTRFLSLAVVKKMKTLATARQHNARESDCRRVRFIPGSLELHKTAVKSPRAAADARLGRRRYTNRQTPSPSATISAFELGLQYLARELHHSLGSLGVLGSGMLSAHVAATLFCLRGVIFLHMSGAVEPNSLNLDTEGALELEQFGALFLHKESGG